MMWKRIDKVLIIDNWLETMPQTTITHHPSTGSDHYPLLLEIINNEGSHTKYFKFLNCWVDSPNFLGIVKDYWDRRWMEIVCGNFTIR